MRIQASDPERSSEFVDTSVPDERHYNFLPDRPAIGGPSEMLADIRQIPVRFEARIAVLTVLGNGKSSSPPAKRARSR